MLGAVPRVLCGEGNRLVTMAAQSLTCWESARLLLGMVGERVIVPAQGRRCWEPDDRLTPSDRWRKCGEGKAKRETLK